VRLLIVIMPGMVDDRNMIWCGRINTHHAYSSRLSHYIGPLWFPNKHTSYALTLKVGVDTDVEISLPISICGLYSLLVSLLCIETPEHVSIVKCVAVSLIAE
jgi:hypothetical protein